MRVCAAVAIACNAICVVCDKTDMEDFFLSLILKSDKIASKMTSNPPPHKARPIRSGLATPQMPP